MIVPWWKQILGSPTTDLFRKPWLDLKQKVHWQIGKQKQCKKFKKVPLHTGTGNTLPTPKTPQSMRSLKLEKYSRIKGIVMTKRNCNPVESRINETVDSPVSLSL